ncbi:hypothetical protein ABFA07_009582 [Porites harrisoni]
MLELDVHIFKFATTLTLSVSVLEGLSENNAFPKAVATTLNRPKKDLHQGEKFKLMWISVRSIALTA